MHLEGCSFYPLSLALAEQLGCVVITLVLKFHYGQNMATDIIAETWILT